VVHVFSLNFDVNTNLTLEIIIKGHFLLLFCFTEGANHFHNAKEKSNNYSERRLCKKGQSKPQRCGGELIAFYSGTTQVSSPASKSNIFGQDFIGRATYGLEHLFQVYLSKD